MADNRTMAQLLQAPTEGYEDAIVIPEINANFELKHGLINLVQNKQFFGHDKEDPHAHIRYFNKITSTMRFSDIPSTSIKLMLFPFSLEGSARIWLEKEPPRSILTWDDLVSKFINQFFPPSKTTNLRNEITRFQQRFDESFYEAWDRFNDLLRACPLFPSIILLKRQEYDHIPPNEKCMALLLAEERFLKIKQTMREEQNQPENSSMIDDEVARDNFLKDVYTFLRKFSRIPFGVTPKVILIAWESFGEIKDALMDKQYRQEDIQELMSKLLEDVRNISEEFSEYINCPSWNRPLFYFDDDDDEYTVIWRRPKAITPVLSTKEPVDSLIMGDEQLDTIPEKESDELIKSSVENLVPIPSESEDFSENESECDMPVCDDFTTFSNPLFDSNDDFTSSDDESLSDEDVPMENFKIYSNPLFVDEEIISPKIDPHYFNAESNLIESLLNRDILIDSSPKFDYLLEEFSGELAHINPIPPGIEKADFDLEEEIRLVKNLLYDNSSPQQLRNEPENEPLITFSPKSDPLHHEFTGEIITIPPGIVREHEDYINRMSLLCSNSSS
ncbi:hypothetical protein Tco_0925267 [Tanacetum coccineum]|uniref:Retrotransposon gag domain-containing protein n=1 Tax=Tanacetum coccineum TaxID=301880 RepID=A0ABQ5D8D7_9ASTR